MKKTLLTLAILGGFSGATFAQASSTPFGVTLFGVIDVGVRAVKNGDNRTAKLVASDGLATNRIGFRGWEDLGSGLYAGFWLEAGLNLDDGTTKATAASTGLFWNRRSTVSIGSKSLGEVRLGRDYAPVYTATGIYDPWGTTGLGEVLGNGSPTSPAGVGPYSTLGAFAVPAGFPVTSTTNTITRVNNQVSYFLPGNLGGVYGQLAAAAPEGSNGGKYYGGRVGYAAGALDVSGAYQQTTVINDDKLKVGLVGASYDFSVVKLFGMVIYSKYDSLAGGDRRQLLYSLGATVPFGASAIRVNAIHGDMKGGAVNSGFGDADDVNQFAIGYIYNFSKRTALYADAATLRNKGSSRLTLAAGNTGDPAMGRGKNSNGYDLGIRHSF